MAFRSYDPEECNRLADFIRDWLAKGGVPTQVVSSEGLKSVVATLGKGDSCLILNAHIDVVKNDPDRFHLRREGDRLIGPGVLDMKASVAVLMKLLTELKSEGPKCRLMVQFVPDEESGGRRGTGFLAQSGFGGDFIICCEPTDLNLSVQCKGVFFSKIVVRGKVAHGARPWLGKNAIVAAMQLYEELQGLPFLAAKSPYFRGATAQVTRIQGGETLNRIPDSSEICLDVRYLPGQTFEEVAGQIQEVCKRHGAVFELIRQKKPIVTPEDHPVVQKLHRLCKKHEPGTVLFGQDGTSDIYYYASLGVPGIEFGPAGGGQHSIEEYVDYRRLSTYKQILKEFVLEF